MTAPIDKRCEDRVEKDDVLSFDEERVLSSIREIVNGIRSAGREVRVEDVEKAVTSIGARVSAEKEIVGSTTLELWGARFTISGIRESGGAIHLSFIPMR